MANTNLITRTVLSSSTTLDPTTWQRGRAVFTTDYGATVTLVPERTASTTYTIRVYQKAYPSGSVSPPFSIDDPAVNAPSITGGITGVMDSDNNIWVLALDGSKTVLQARKLIYGSGTWTAPTGWKVVATASGASTIVAFDAAVGSDDKLFVAMNVYNGSNQLNLVVKKEMTPYSSPFFSTVSTTLVANGYTARADGVSIAVLDTSTPSGTADNIVVASGSGITGTDNGVKVYTGQIIRSTGLPFAPLSLRATYFSGEAATDSPGTTTPWINGRNVKLFTRYGDPDGYFLAVMHADYAMKSCIHGGLFDGDNWTPQTSTSMNYSGLRTSANLMAISVTRDTFNFMYASTADRPAYILIAKFTGAGYTTAWTWSGKYTYLFGPGPTNFVHGVAGSGNAGFFGGQVGFISWQRSRAASGVQSSTDKVYVILADNVNTAGAPSISTPSEGAVVNTSMPLMSLTKAASPLAQSKERFRVQFSTASDFSAIVVDYQQPESKYYLFPTGVAHSVSDVLPAPLPGGTIYARTRTSDEWGISSAWSATRTFTVLHPPLARLLTYKEGVSYLYGTGEVNFDWEFTDTSPDDYQTAYQFVLMDSSGTVITDTGKITSGLKRYTYTVDEIYKDVDLKWTIKLWDSNDDGGEYAAPAFFILTDPPTVVIISPEDGDILPTGMPHISAKVGVSGVNTIRELTFTISLAGQQVWSTRVAGALPDEEVITLQVPKNVLLNNTTYTLKASVISSINMTATSPSIQFTTAWVPPNAATGVDTDATYYSRERDDLSDPGGYVKVRWDDLQRDVDFFSWNVYRRDDLYDWDTETVLELGTWKQVHQEFQAASLYVFKDFFAPTNYRTVYSVRQQVNVDGQDIESGNSSLSSVVPISDGYWLIEQSGDDIDTFKLSIVTADSFTDEQEEAEFLVIGRGRVMNRGEDIGIKGTLDAQIRHTGGTTARQKRLRLKEAQETRAPLWLRNPFGDVYRVNVSAMSISRVAGVGQSEFIDVSIPYSEIAD